MSLYVYFGTELREKKNVYNNLVLNKLYKIVCELWFLSFIFK